MRPFRTPHQPEWEWDPNLDVAPVILFLGPAAPWVVDDPALNVTPITPELPEID